MEKVMPRLADQLDPEGHHLHVAARASAGDGVLAKTALYLDHAEHQLRIKPRARRLVVHRAQELQTLLAVRDALLQARVHIGEPALRVARRAKHHLRNAAVRDLLREPHAHRVGERLVVLCAGKGAERSGDQHNGGERSQASFCCSSGTTSASGTSLAFSSRRALYSALPAASPRSPITTRCGMPMRSMSAKSIPGRSSRSSSSTSIPSSRSWS